MKIRIANPIYDAAFKYLMNDPESARLFISRLIDAEVLELEFAATEHQTKLKAENLTVFHLDFAARIRLADNTERRVLIEIQKAKLPGDIQRFRRYLGHHYQSDTALSEGPDGKSQPLPILSIYFLGHGLERIKAAVVKVKREYYDGVTDERLEERDPFVESLTHDSVVVQIPYLREPGRTDLERLLSIFNQSRRRPEDHHVLEVDDEEYPLEYHRVLRRLMAAIADEEVHETMRMEDEILTHLQELERKVEEQQRIAEEKAREAEEKAREAEEKAREAEEQRRVAEAQRRVAEEQRRVAEEKERALEEQRQVAEAQRRLAEEKERALEEQRRLTEARRRKAIEALVEAGVPRAEAEAMFPP